MELARHKDPRVRTAVALGLKPTGDREIGLLEALSNDPFPEVRQTARAAIEGFLGPEELRGPPTAEEWAALRAAHARVLHTPEAAEEKVLFRPMPEGPWAPEDRAVIDEALRRLRAGDPDLAPAIVQALAGKPAHEDLEEPREIGERGPALHLGGAAAPDGSERLGVARLERPHAGTLPLLDAPREGHDVPGRSDPSSL